MTRQQAIRYANECRYASAHGLPTPPRPDGFKPGTRTRRGIPTDNAPATPTTPIKQQGASDIVKALTTTAIKVEMLNALCDQIDDALYDVALHSPRMTAYRDLFGYLWQELQDIENTLKRIK